MKANTTAMDYSAKVFNTKDPKLKAKYTKKFEEYMKKYHADMNRYKKYKNQLKPAKTKKKRVNKTKTTDQAAMVSKIEQHKKEFTNEGNMAIFPTLNGTESDIVMRPIEEDVDRKLLHQAIEKLTAREREIITMRFGLDGAREQTQKECADRLGISQSYISRLEKKIISKLKKEILRLS